VEGLRNSQAMHFSNLWAIPPSSLPFLHACIKTMPTHPCAPTPCPHCPTPVCPREARGGSAQGAGQCQSGSMIAPLFICAGLVPAVAERPFHYEYDSSMDRLWHQSRQAFLYCVNWRERPCASYVSDVDSNVERPSPAPRTGNALLHEWCMDKEMKLMNMLRARSTFPFV
jgi:hypothetical protein